jgi:hypothetical protein
VRDIKSAASVEWHLLIVLSCLCPAHKQRSFSHIREFLTPHTSRTLTYPLQVKFSKLASPSFTFSHSFISGQSLGLIAAELQIIHFASLLSCQLLSGELQRANMNTFVGGNLGAMPAPPPEVQIYWSRMRVQITPWNSIISLDGHDFRTLSDASKDWMSAEYL